ncbi:MAG TPA: 2'-5' RNA ligase family protein [Anaerolineae bacterium]|nr:2'-5' RNA ligase family protein [Anaerolineae bacterium]HQH39741.1 2'-5' RNA ligase family protein [Anaerolineae bacterium]
MSTKTVCVIPVSNVPDELKAFRQNHIQHPGAAIPLHTTVLPYFLASADLTNEVIGRLQTLADSFSPFEYFAQPICAFPTSRTLWLSPSPQSHFEKVTEALCSEFPQFRGGVGYPVYHLTIAYGAEEAASPELAQRFVEQFKPQLPFRFIADELAVYGEFDNTWKHILSVPFRSR